jgi:hypothetical protein
MVASKQMMRKLFAARFGSIPADTKAQIPAFDGSDPHALVASSGDALVGADQVLLAGGLLAAGAEDVELQ